MRYLFTFITLFIIILMTSCRKDFSTSLSTGNLKFSTDTVFVGKVFDNISSSTHRFTVKNPSDKDIKIPVITLEQGENSFYRLNVDGIAGKWFENVEILAKDSIYVFVEATIPFNQIATPDFMYRDKVLFDSNTNQQNVILEAQVIDVHLIRPNRTQIADGFTYENIILGQDTDGNAIGIRGTNLTDDTTFTNDKPWLIYNYVGVPSGKTLTIDAGTQVHFHANSGIIIQDGGKLVVNGTLDNKVVIQGDRLEEVYQDVPGQWGTIWLYDGSKESEIHHAKILNATLGLLVDSNNDVSEKTLLLNNTEIYNTTSYGMLGRNAKIEANNVVIGNNGASSFANILGGNYDFSHVTLANFWRSSNRQEATLSLSNASQISDTEYLLNNLQANFTNCIIDGSQNVELQLEKLDGADFNFNFKNCLLKFIDDTNQFADNALYNFNDVTYYTNDLFNKN
ncbi:MAG TPA: hypothetical protein ENK67_07070, partial [Flavobacteriia bacterium]|nr:hypothetical protein [Flavobacteriia bacterium]